MHSSLKISYSNKINDSTLKEVQKQSLITDSFVNNKRILTGKQSQRWDFFLLNTRVMLGQMINLYHMLSLARFKPRNIGMRDK